MFLQEFNQTPSKKLSKLNRMLSEQFGVTVKKTFPSKSKLDKLLENANMTLVRLRDSNQQFQLESEYAKFLGIKDIVETMISEGMYAESPRYMEMKNMLKSTVMELMDMGYTLDEAASECMNRYRMDNRFAYDDEFVLPLVLTAAKDYMTQCSSMAYESSDAYEMNERLLRELADVMGVSLKDSRSYQQIEEKLSNFARVSGKSKESVIGFLNGLDETALLAAIQMFGRKIAEANAFVKARRDAIRAGKKEFKVGGKTYKVTGDTSDEKEEVNESEGKERPYVCVHAKKGKTEVTANSAYGAAKKAAAKWGLKSTAGIDAYLADVTHTPTESMVKEGMPSSVIKSKQRLSYLTPKEFAARFVDKSDDELIMMARRHVLPPMTYVNKRNQGLKQSPNAGVKIEENMPLTWQQPSDGNWYFVSTIDDERGIINSIEQRLKDGTIRVIHRAPRMARHGENANDHVKALPDSTSVHIHTPPKVKGGGYDIKQSTLGQLHNAGILENTRNNELVENVNVEEAEVVMAMRAMADDIQDQVERIGRMMNEDLPAIVDKMRTEMGADTAYSFAQSVNQTLSEHLDATKAVKMNLDKAIGGLTGEAVIDAAEPMSQEPTLPEEHPEEDEIDVNEPAAAGPEESPLGRAEI